VIVDGVYLEARTAALIAPALKAWASSWQRVNGGPLPEPVLRFVSELDAVARAVRVRNTRNTAADESAHDHVDELGVCLSTETVAVMLEISERAVRGLCERERLDATKNRTGSWQIDPESVTAYNVARRRA